MRLLFKCRFLPLLVAALSLFNASAQKFTWSIDFESVFDNREGDGGITPADTYIFTNIAPEVGIHFGKYGRIAGGAVWNQPIGNDWKDSKVSPVVYYRYDSSKWKFSMGIFPYSQLIQELPGFLRSDSLCYYQHNVRGALAQYESKSGFAELYLDWRQLRSDTQREAFNVVFHGQWSPGRRIFFTGAHAMLNHYALTKNAGPDQHIVDNVLLNPYMGMDFGGKTRLDSLMVRCGIVANIERNREFENWESSAGVWLEAVGEWKFLGLKNTLYAGKALLRSYPAFGPALYPGDPYYQKKFYNRTDVYARIIDSSKVNLLASLDFHVSPGEFMFYQKLILKVYFSSF